MDKLSSVRQQKQSLRLKLLQLQNKQKISPELSQQTLALLLQKKQKIEHQRIQQQKYRKLQQQYFQRKNQIERQKQLEKIQNQKRLIQLEVGMKKIVLNTVQEKVKGINSEQLFTRAILSQKERDPNAQNNLYKLKGKNNIKNQFQKYLINQDIKKQKEKYDLYELNNKRYELFEKKQQLIMRQILLKQYMNNLQNNSNIETQLPNIDPLSCPRPQLQQLIKQYGYDIDQYLHPIDPKKIISQYPQIQQSITTNITHHRQQLTEQSSQQQNYLNYTKGLKKYVQNYRDQQKIKDIKSIINDLIEKLIYQYQKRHYPLSKGQKKQRIDEITKQLNRIQLETQADTIAKYIVNDMEIRLLKQLLQQSCQQTCLFQQFSLNTTNKSFDFIFNKQSYEHILSNQNSLHKSIQLFFSQSSDNLNYNNQQSPFGKKNIKNSIQPTLNNPKQSQNIFETQKNNTSQLINDIKLLAVEQEYFQSIVIEIGKQYDGHDQIDFKVLISGQLYIISSKGIKQVIDVNRGNTMGANILSNNSVSNNNNNTKNNNNNNNKSNNNTTYRTVLNFSKQIKQIKNVKKINNTFIIQTKQLTYIFTQWNHQSLPYMIGQRINNPSAMFSSCEIYPNFSLLGSLCSILLGFQKGQILKYNFNRNRITNQQTNISHYVPLGPRIKTGDQPSFPLNNKHVLQYKIQKAKQSQQTHEFREFFDHHTTQIISICFYKSNQFISIDKSLKCCIWLYNQKLSNRSYQPLYTFRISSTYKIYKQSQNPRFKDLYPSTTIKQPAQQLYQKWMEHQTFLKLQIYNNPKKSSAFFKSPKTDNQKNQQPIWKISYDEKQKKIVKIYETYYNLADGKIQGKQAKVWGEYLVVLVERQHVMRNDLKTIKVYFWSIQQKRLRTVGIQFDTFSDQKHTPFSIIQPSLSSFSLQYSILCVISSGKILLFSILTGQLLKDISQQPSCNKIRQYNFINININQLQIQNVFYGNTMKNIVEFVIKNKNRKEKDQQFNKMIEIARKKYNNLV